ncbi:MAG: VWA domain-containing protein, partial [Planctomycetes bacterium]|nr:VWA domain-containing protein [Planctomycetota bacterium]
SSQPKGSDPPPQGDASCTLDKETPGVIAKTRKTVRSVTPSIKRVVDYFHIGVIGYGNKVGPVLARPPINGELEGVVGESASTAITNCLMPVSDVANKPLRVETRTKQVDDGAGGLVSQTIKFPVWFEPVAYGATPMGEAMDKAWHVLVDFLNRYPGCYPPVVINITDGEATDADPEKHAACIRNLAGSDGNALLFNLHISSLSDLPILFPDKSAVLADDYAQMLFRMSSILPPRMWNEAKKEGHRLSELSRGFAFNADLVSVIKFLDIGTRVSQTLS